MKAINFRKELRLLVLIILTYCTVPLSAENYIVVSAYGQLGNALFQTATALPLALEYGYKVIIDESYKRNYPTVFRDFSSLAEYNKSSLGLVSQVLHFKSIQEIKPLVRNRKNIFLEVGSFCFEDFKNYKELIVKTFSPPAELVNKLRSKHSFLEESRVVVGVHIRTFYKDLLWELEHGRTMETLCKTLPLPDIHFLVEAIEYFPKDVLFVICSDNIPLVRKMCATFPERDYLFVEGNTDEEDFYLLTLCNHLIISPYSFSWWAAYLNTHPKKIVIAPQYDHFSFPEGYVFLPYSAPSFFDIDLDNK